MIKLGYTVSISIYILASVYLGLQRGSVTTSSFIQDIDLPLASEMSLDLHNSTSKFMFETKCTVDYELHSGGVALCAQNDLATVTDNDRASSLTDLISQSVNQKKQQDQDELRRKFAEAKNILKSIELVDVGKSSDASTKVRDAAFLLLHVFENHKRPQ